jgi:uncharacterized protein (DUF488 family)
MAYPFFTIGHSTRPMGDFIDLLRQAQIELVADVRSVPRSRRNPQYNDDVLPETLAGFQIGCEHIAALGGLRPKAKDISPDLNAFWQNESFHNYADYALSQPFHSGLDRLRALGQDRRCARWCGGDAIGASSRIISSPLVRPYSTFSARIASSRRA